MRFLLCTDGSPYGQTALRFGAVLAKKSPDKVTLLGVIEPGTDPGDIESALDEGRRWLGDAPAVVAKIRHGHAAEEILDQAASGAHDLVVVGARGRRGLTRFVLGSTSERIARHATLPVLIVHSFRPSVERILLCTAAAEPSSQVLNVGAEVALLAQAPVTVLHVMSQLAAMPHLPADSLEDLEASADGLMARHTREGAYLAEALQLLADRNVNAEARVRHGLVVDEILCEVVEGDYDLVVIGAHRAQGWMRFLLDDITHQILGHTDRPVLVARA